MANGSLMLGSVNPPEGEWCAEQAKLARLLWAAAQRLPVASTARAFEEVRPPPVKSMARVKSAGWVERMGRKGVSGVGMAKSAATLAPGLCAMLMAAVAVSVGVMPALMALAKRVVQAEEAEPGGVDAGGEDVGEGVDLGLRDGAVAGGGGGERCAGGEISEVGGVGEGVGDAGLGECGVGGADVGGVGGEG